MDVRRILDTIWEVEEWTQRIRDMEERLRNLPRSERASLGKELEIARQQLLHYQALVEEMKRSTTKPALDGFFEQV